MQVGGSQPSSWSMGPGWVLGNPPSQYAPKEKAQNHKPRRATWSWEHTGSRLGRPRGPPRMQTPIQAALPLTQNRLVPTTGSSTAWLHLPATCPRPTPWPTTGSCWRVRFIWICLPFGTTTRSQASPTVRKTLPREESASKEGPGSTVYQRLQHPSSACTQLSRGHSHSGPGGSAGAQPLCPPTCPTRWEPSPMRTPGSTRQGAAWWGLGKDPCVQTRDAHPGTTPPAGDHGHSLETSGCHKWGLILASSGRRPPGMLLNTLQGTGQPPRHKCRRGPV